MCIEPHGIYTKTADGLLRIVGLVDSPWIAINWDTGNSFLAGVEDPYDGLLAVRDHVPSVSSVQFVDRSTIAAAAGVRAPA